MKNVFSTLFNNARLFPKFAALVGIAYLLFGVGIAVPVAHQSHSVPRGVSFAVLVLSLCAVFDFILYYAISLNPAWFARCQEFADAFARIFLMPRPASSPATRGEGFSGSVDDMGGEEIEPEDEDEELNKLDETRGH
jgi:hypothetical protein